jgi:hypothetical protein
MSKIINFNQISIALTGKKDLIRSNKIPNKYSQRINKLLYYIQCWEKDIDLIDKNSLEKLNNDFYSKVSELQKSNENLLKNTENTLICINDFIHTVKE